MITASRSGADLVSHWVVPAGIRSALYSSVVPHRGSCGVTVVPAEGMMHSSGSALPGLPELPLAFPRTRE